GKRSENDERQIGPRKNTPGGKRGVFVIKKNPGREKKIGGEKGNKKNSAKNFFFPTLGGYFGKKKLL
ncbi:hypothetical protein DNR41_27690, partial [Escherichia coli]|uniref:hypothetical protein n=1 Tax=Escherichia coli TaxID=562 RepID=UPI000DBBBDF9